MQRTYQPTRRKPAADTNRREGAPRPGPDCVPAAVPRPRRGRKRATTRTPGRVTTAPPLFRFVRPWWSTSWAAPLWTVPATGAATWAAIEWAGWAPWAAVAALVALAVLVRRPLTRHGLRLAGALAGLLAAVLAASTAPDVGRGAVLILSLIHISEPTRPY